MSLTLRRPLAERRRTAANAENVGFSHSADHPPNALRTPAERTPNGTPPGVTPLGGYPGGLGAGHRRLSEIGAKP